MSNIEVSSNGGSTLETASKFAFGLLGLGVGLEVAGAAETIIGKVATVIGATAVGAYAGKSLGRAAA